MQLIDCVFLVVFMLGLFYGVFWFYVIFVVVLCDVGVENEYFLVMLEGLMFFYFGIVGCSVGVMIVIKQVVIFWKQGLLDIWVVIYWMELKMFVFVKVLDLLMLWQLVVNVVNSQ